MDERIVLLGKGDLAVSIAEWLFYNSYTIDKVVPVIPEPDWCSSLAKWATKKGIEVVSSGDYKEAGSAIDIAISIFYEKIINQEFINRCGKIINLHNSPLPKYRGVRPINWALKNNERKHGVTIHKITEGIDDGPIYGQITYPIYPNTEEVEDVYHKSKWYGLQLFKEVFPRLHSITPYKQNENEASYYSNKEVEKLGNRSDFKR
jgi:methionyl-tRNA formyltransferase|tara:strand:- start:465 stop:1079 length:615 start_codon:yes stop_codon:yes gene_type:complete